MDIFDRIMMLPVLRLFQSQYRKYKEPLLYLLFGVLTTLVNVLAFACFIFVFDINALTSNVFSWILSVAFAYITNKIWVFGAKSKTFSGFLKQMLSFLGSRLVTLGIEELIMLVFVTWLDFDSMIIKIVAQIIVIALNYLASKLWIFKK